MMRMTQKQFDSNKSTYSRINNIRKGWYEVECVCNRCNGRGYISFSSVDNSKCWKCNTTGKVFETIQIVKDSKSKVEDLEKAKQRTAKAHIKEGYKKVDFEFADWFKYPKIDNRYYKVERETSKAVLIDFIDSLESCTHYQDWFPKSALHFINK